MAGAKTRSVPRYRHARAALAVGVVLLGALAGYFVRGRARTRAGPRAARGDFEGITSIALGPSDTMYVGGEFGVKVLGPDLEPGRGWRTEGPVTALCVDKEGAVYAACGRRVRKFDSRGRRLLVLGRGGCEGEPFGFVSGIAAAQGNIFVADAGSRMVYRFRDDGTYLGEIGAKEDDPDGLGFIVPSPYFDVAASEGVLLVTNPGRRRVEMYDYDGKRLAHWGRGGRKDDELPGCCNPTNIALFRDGRVAASQKGKPVVKVFGSGGKLLALFGEGAFERECRGIDLAVDSGGRIYAVDPAASRVRTFEAGAGARASGTAAIPAKETTP